jgi:hypothetical protein
MVKKWGGAFIVFILGMGACSQGVRDVREGLANRTPTNMACAEFSKRLPADTWVHLTGAVGALREAAYRSKDNVVDRVYVPLKCEDVASKGYRMVLATEDPTLIGALNAKQDVEVRRDIDGMVRTSKDHQTETTSGGGLEGGGCVQCPAKIQGLEYGYVVIEEGVEPSLPRGLAYLIGMTVAWVFTWRLARS